MRLFTLFIVAASANLASTQPATSVAPPVELSRDEYILAATGELEIQVHIWGEVLRPGLYQVPDGTNLLEAFSEAGGPTEYANLSRIRITRRASGSSQASLMRYDLDEYLSDPTRTPPPRLRPGDVVHVPRNTKYAWREAVRIVAEVATVVTAIYLVTKR